METKTINKKILEKLNEIQVDIHMIKENLVNENYELADDVVQEIEESKKRSEDEMISHEEMKREFEDE